MYIGNIPGHLGIAPISVEVTNEFGSGSWTVNWSGRGLEAVFFSAEDASDVGMVFDDDEQGDEQYDGLEDGCCGEQV